MNINSLKSAYDRLLYLVFKCYVEDEDEYKYSFSEANIRINDIRVAGINISQHPKALVPSILEAYDIYGNEIPVDNMKFWEDLESALKENNIINFVE